MAWRLNPALSTLRAEVNARWPNRDKTSDGTIGDLAHQGTVSDHNPDRDGSVDAWDMDVDGVDVWQVIGAFEKHVAARYWIYNRQIATRANRWRREPYGGSNPHDKHVHLNTDEDHENSTAPFGIWPPPPPEDDMAWTDKLAGTTSTTARFGPGDHQAQTLLKLAAIHAYDAAKGAAANRLLAEAILAKVAGDDQEAVLARVDALAQQIAEQAAAEADRDAQLRALVEKATTGEMTAGQVVDELARRLAAGGDHSAG